MRTATIERTFAGDEAIIPVDKWDVAAALHVDPNRVSMSSRSFRESGLYLVELQAPAETARLWIVPR